ncbi:MAG TPA: CopD family protein [Gammaproteobacteria bacterium]|nr:CopD family protein [Gammaproteobacteria bacterium]
MAWHEAVTGFDVLGVTLAFGAIAAALWLFSPAAAASAEGIEIGLRFRTLLAAALALLTLTSAAVLVGRSIAISGLSLAHVGRVIPLVLHRTDFGRVWIARAAAVLLSWAVWRRWNPASKLSSVRLWLLLALVSVVAFSRSATGHAGDHGDFRAAVWIDWLHLLAAGLWGGVIVAFLTAVTPARLRSLDGEKEAAAALLRRFSRLAAAGLALAAISGVYKAWQVLGGWRPLWESRYGLILDAKLALAIAMALLGASNRFRHVPEAIAALRGSRKENLPPDAFRGLISTAAAEAVLWLCILAAVALLLHAMPPTASPS